MQLYDIKVRDADANEIGLGWYKGKVLLIVNSATECGFTPQYEGLQKLWEKYKDQGFEILDFPCNQFAEQSPGTNEEIQDFCAKHYGVTFKIMDKIDVNGENESPLYTFLKAKHQGIAGADIKWNFTKFLIDREGNVVGRYAPTITPEELCAEIERYL